MQGKIVKGVGGFYYIHLHDEIVYECRAKGAFRNRGMKPAVGDDVEIEILDEQSRTGNLVDILPRKNLLIRPAVANVDQAVLVFALADPKPNLNLLDRFLITMEQQQLETLICLNKSDLVEQKQAEDIASIYRQAGYQVFVISTKEQDNQGFLQFCDMLRDKTSVLAGPSGVGKSSLLNRLAPHVQAQTGSISEKIKRGKHTTRHSELLCISQQTFVMDTPGFTSLYIDGLSADELKDYIREFEPYNGTCKFNGCVHIHEPQCNVKQAVSDDFISKCRYENYIQIYEELKNKRRW